MRPLVFALVALITINPAHPSMAATGMSPSQVGSTSAMLTNYLAKQRGTPAGQQLLEAIHAGRLEPSSTNTKAVRNALARRLRTAEKIVLIRILGSLYTFNNQSGMNDDIVRDLRGLVYSGDQELARTAVLALSRTGHIEDLHALLTYAVKRGAISKEEHYGELAHALPYAPRGRQTELISLIAKESSPYSLEILANGLDRRTVQQLTPDAAQAMMALMKRHEPNFPMSLERFGYRDALRYTYWLNAAALLHEATGAGSYEAFALDQLNSARTDPRKVIGFLSAPEGQRLIAAAPDKKQFAQAASKAKDYSESLPQNQIMRDLVERIETSLAAR